MSRIGKKPILIPAQVEMKTEAGKVMIKGPKGELNLAMPEGLKFEIQENKIFVSPVAKTKEISRMWGTFRALLLSHIKGVTEGYTKKMEIAGIGYKAQLEGPNLSLSVGFSHPVKVLAPEGIKFSVEGNVITVSGIDKNLVGQTAANVHKVKNPDPYKQKGIRYVGEVLRKKAGKKVVAAAGK